MPLFVINGQTITLWNILILMVVGWLLGLLPSPFREIAGVILVLWVLSVLGILSFIPGLSNILVLVIILGLVFYIIGPRRYRF